MAGALREEVAETLDAVYGGEFENGVWTVAISSPRVVARSLIVEQRSTSFFVEVITFIESLVWKYRKIGWRCCLAWERSPLPCRPRESLQA